MNHNWAEWVSWERTVKISSGLAEAETSFGKKTYARVFGIVQLKLIEDPRTAQKYHGEILIHGCVVQTGTYHGTLQEAQKQLHEHACTVLMRACNDIMSEGK